MIEEKKIQFSDSAKVEIAELQKICDKLFVDLSEESDDMIAWHAKIACMEQKIVMAEK